MMKANKAKRKLCSCGKVAGMLPLTGQQVCRSCYIQPYLFSIQEISRRYLQEVTKPDGR